MSGSLFLIIGATHIDIAWKKGFGEMVELFESFIIRLLDLLDHEPQFTYVLEQASHFRRLAASRPDLVARLKRHLEEGRLEFVGGMATTMETNVPNGECFIRNQFLGRRWVEKNFGVRISTGWLIDTFGLNRQIPQVLSQFGIKRLIANRLGSQMTVDHFSWEGLDGSRIQVLGVDVGSPFVKSELLFFGEGASWKALDALFDRAESRAAEANAEGLYIVMPYTENERLPSRHIAEEIRNRNGEGKRLSFSLPHQAFEELERREINWQLVSQDLNPEFTGTYSNRITLRLRNRSVETLLLEAQKWAGLLGRGRGEDLTNAWWDLADNQFHDVLTGSHGTAIYRDVLGRYDRIERTARGALEKAFEGIAPKAGADDRGETIGICLFNGLPWSRGDVVFLALPPGWEGAKVYDAGKPEERLPSLSDACGVRFLAEIPATGYRWLTLKKSCQEGEEPRKATEGTIENEFIRLDCDIRSGIVALIDKRTGYRLLEDCGDFLVVQQDQGNFQIEDPRGLELSAASGQMDLRLDPAAEWEKRMVLSGRFPPIPWAGDENHLEWRIEFRLYQFKRRLDVLLTIDWHGEATRIRFKLPTEIDTDSALYEIPFGVLAREGYGMRKTACGEWPAHRFVAVEMKNQALGLVNTGCCGVECRASILQTTLLRAPAEEFAGMVPDDSSSQHGTHHFRFGLLAYSGRAERWTLFRAAQELNTPVLFQLGGHPDRKRTDRSLLELKPNNLTLSAVKPAEDGARELVIRFYETAGRLTEAWIRLEAAKKIWRSDVTERKAESLDCRNGSATLAVRPFEIVTLRVQR